jgi:hypothetical protein
MNQSRSHLVDQLVQTVLILCASILCTLIVGFLFGWYALIVCFVLLCQRARPAFCRRGEAETQAKINLALRKAVLQSELANQMMK